MILINNNKKHICDHHVDLIWNDEDDDDDDDEDGDHHVHLIWNDEDDDDDGWFLSLESLPHHQFMCLV